MQTIPSEAWTSLFVCPSCLIYVKRNYQDMMGGGKIEYVDQVFTKQNGDLIMEIGHTTLSKKLKTNVKVWCDEDTDTERYVTDQHTLENCTHCHTEMKLLKRTDGWTKNYECPTCKRFMTKTAQDLMS